MKYLCIKRKCCLDVQRYSKILDNITVFEKSLKVNVKDLASVWYKDLQLIKNALIKVINSIDALNKRFKHIRSVNELTDVDTIVNTLTNVLNRLIECYNILHRLKDEVSVDSVLNDTLISLVSEICITTFNAMHFVTTLPSINRDSIGRIASAIANALLLTFLYIDREEIRHQLKLCLGDEESRAHDH